MAVLPSARVTVTDTSWQHAGHADAVPTASGIATHVAITVVAPDFEGQPTIDRHRQIYKALKPALALGLHAMELEALAPSEVQS